MKKTTLNFIPGCRTFQVRNNNINPLNMGTTDKRVRSGMIADVKQELGKLRTRRELLINIKKHNVL